MNASAAPTWSFLTNHGQALLAISSDPEIRLRDLADGIGVTERAAHRIVSELVESGYVLRDRVGRRNSYEVRTDQPIGLLGEHGIELGSLLRLFGADEPPRRLKTIAPGG